MDTGILIVIWILIVGLVVGLLAWFGPRPSQWRAQSDDEEPGPGDPGNSHEDPVDEP